MVAGVALERQHRVDHVLDDARSGDLAVLGDMADEDHRRAAGLREPDQRLRRAAHLGDGSGRRFDGLGPHRLDRVDDGERRRLALRRGSRRCPRRWSRLRARRRRRRGQGARPEAAPARSLPRPRYRRRACPALASAAETCISSVDLPMPGSPPMRITEPRTKPPPVTRSNSARPDGVRGASCVSPARPSSGNTRPFARLGRVATGPASGCAAPVSSTTVFQPPQASQRPFQRW